MNRAILIATVILLAAAGAAPARADTLADCGRFYLKYNEDTKQMDCVGAKRKRKVRAVAPESIARDLQRSLRGLQSVVGQAEQLLLGDELTQEVEQRVQALLNEARERTSEVQRKSSELAAANRTRSRELASEQRQATQAQAQMARQLEQKQQALTQQLMAEQRSRTQGLLRAPTGQ